MTCTNCGSAFHEKWACTKPLKVAEEAISTAARKDVQPSVALNSTLPDARERGSQRVREAGTQAPPVDTNSVCAKNAPTPKRGRPKTITDMRTYKANKAKQYPRPC